LKLIVERQQGFLFVPQAAPVLAAQKHGHKKAGQQDAAENGDGECFHGGFVLFGTQAATTCRRSSRIGIACAHPARRDQFRPHK
jgi:hypothetical protein